jgi:hypothetical protein
MPRSAINTYKDDILELKEEGIPNNEVLSWLQERGITVGDTTLRMRLKEWGWSKKTTVPQSPELISRVNHLFHHTLLSDSQIAERIAEEDGLPTTKNQIYEIRMRHGWKRATFDRTAQADQKQRTQELIQDLVLVGPGRSFGRIWSQTYLRQKLGYRARRNDVAAALKHVDPEGVASRQPGLRRQRIENYITAGPNQV